MMDCFTSDEKAMRVVCASLGFDALAQGVDPKMVASALIDPSNPVLRAALNAYHQGVMQLADAIAKESEASRRRRRKEWLEANHLRPHLGFRPKARSSSFLTILPDGTTVRKRSHGIVKNVAFIGCFTDGKRLFANAVAPEATTEGHPIYVRGGIGVEQIALLAIREG